MRKKDAIDFQPAETQQIDFQPAPSAPAGIDFQPAKPIDFKPIESNPEVVEPGTTALGAFMRGTPGVLKETLTDAAKQTAAAAAYEGAGAVKGATLGYVDPTHLLDQTALGQQPIYKPAAEAAGTFAGFALPAGAVSKVIGLGAKAAGLANYARPFIQGLAESAAGGGVVGAASKPEEGQTRTQNALRDAALFTGLTGAAEGISRLGEISNAIKEWATTKKVDIPVTAGQVKDFFRFASDKLDPEIIGALKKLPQDELKTIFKSNKDITLSKRVPRFGESQPISEPVSTPPPAPSPVQGEKLPALTPEADKYISNSFPTLRQAVDEAPSIHPEMAKQVLHQATAAGEEAKLLGADAAEADRIAAQTFQKSHQDIAGARNAETSQEFLKHYTPAENLSPEETQLQAQGADFAAKNAPQLLQDYASKFGNEISTDKFRDLLKPAGYNGLNAHVFHETASALRKAYEPIVMAQAKAAGKTDVLMMAGGSGAGKTSNLAKAGIDKSQFGMILDSNLANMNNAVRDIERLTDQGFSPTIAYVYRHPMDAFVNGVMKRITSKSDYRIVTVQKHMELHKGAYETIVQLADKYGEEIPIHFIDNSRGKNNVQRISLEELKAKGYNDSGLEGRLNRVTQALLRREKIGSREASAAIGGRIEQGQLGESRSRIGSTGSAGNEGIAGRAGQSESASEITSGGTPPNPPVPPSTGIPQPEGLPPLPSRAKEPKVYTEKFALRRSLQRQATAAAQAARFTRQDLTNFKKGIADNINAVLPPDERGRFLGAVASANTARDLISVVQRVDAVAESSQKSYLINRLQREFQRLDASKSVAIDYIQKIRGLFSGLEIPGHTTAKLQQINEIQKYIDRQRLAGQDVSMPQYILDQLKVLGRKPAKDMSVAELENVMSEMRNLADLGKTKLRARQAIEEAQRTQNLADLAAGTVPLNRNQLSTQKPAGLGEPLSVGQKFVNGYRKSLNLAQDVNFAIMPMDVMFDLMDGNQMYAGPNFRIFKQTADTSFGNYTNAAADMKEAAWKMAQDLKLDQQAFERIGIYAIMVQENGVKKLASLGITPQEIASIKLLPNELKFYEFMRKNLDDLRPRIAETMKTVYNTEIGDVKNYFPFVTDWDSMSEFEIKDRMVDQASAQAASRKNVARGFTKERVGPGKQKVKIDAMDVYLKHVDDVQYLVNMGQTTKRLGELAASEEYRAAAGDLGQRLVRDWVDVLARKGHAAGEKTVPWLDSMRANIGVATLGLKLSTALIQTTAVFDGASMIGSDAFAGAIDIGTSKAWRVFLKENFPELRARGADDPSYLEFSKDQSLASLQQKGMWAVQKLDFLSAASVVAGAYRHYFSLKGLPVDLSYVDPKAVAYAQLILRRTQGSSFFKDVPLSLSKGAMTGNKSFDKTIFQFQNFTLNNWSRISHEGYRAGIKQGRYGQGMNALFWSLLVASMYQVGLRRGVDVMTGRSQWKDSYFKDVAQDMMGNVPFVPQIMSMAVYGREASPVLATAKQLIQGAYATVKPSEDKQKSIFATKKSTGMTRVKGAVNALTAGARFAGIPGTAQAEQILRNLFKGEKQQPGLGRGKLQ